MICFVFFFFNDTATTEIYTLSLHDALPIWSLAKRLLNSTLTETSESEPPKKMMSTHGENLDTEVQNLQTSGLRNLGRRSKISAASRSATADHAATNVRNKSESAAEPEFKQPTTERLLVPTTKDKHIPCKGVP